MRGKFNIFQAAMLRWREHEPYNAVHAIALTGSLDVARLGQAIDGQLGAWGLREVTLAPALRRYEYRAGAASAEVPVLDGGGDPDVILAQEMQRQLGRSFPHDGTYAPFRFFAVTAGDSFRLGVAYDHVFAGGDAIIALLKGIAQRYLGRDHARGRAPELYPATYSRLLRGEIGAFLRGLTAFPRIALRVRRCVRPRYPYGEGRESGFVQLRLTAAETDAIRGCAKKWSVRVNDMMLALALQALGVEVTGRESARRRNEIAIASVINIRDGITGSPDEVFGQFLSSFLVSHRVPAGLSLSTLARDVAVQTREVKGRKLYLQTLWAIAVGDITWRTMSPAHRNRMFARNYPVWAGMTTLNVDPIWNAAPGDLPVPAYVRGVSTGPFAPLVIAPATAAGRMTLGITYRTAAFRAEDIARLTENILVAVRQLQ